MKCIQMREAFILKFMIVLAFLLLLRLQNVFGQTTVEFSPELNQTATIYRVQVEENRLQGNYFSTINDIYRAHDFSASVEKGKLPTIIEYPNGAKFKIVHSLGGGNINRIFEVIDLRTNKRMALRVPQSAVEPIVQISNMWGDTHSEFTRTQVVVPQMYEHVPSQYTTTEVIDYKFSLNDLIIKPNELDFGESTKAVKEFKNFLLSRGELISIDDGHPENIVFDGNKWIVLDWRGGPEKISVKALEEGIIHSVNDLYNIENTMGQASYLRGYNEARYPLGRTLYRMAREIELPYFRDLYRSHIVEFPEKLRAASFEDKLKYIKLIYLKRKTRIPKLVGELLLFTEDAKELKELLLATKYPLSKDVTNLLLKKYFSLESSIKPNERLSYLKKIVQVGDDSVLTKMFSELANTMPFDELVELMKEIPIKKQVFILAEPIKMIFNRFDPKYRNEFLSELKSMEISSELKIFVQESVKVDLSQYSEVPSEHSKLSKKLKCMLNRLAP